MFGKIFLAAALSLSVIIAGALGFSVVPQAVAHMGTQVGDRAGLQTGGQSGVQAQAQNRHPFLRSFPGGLITATECLALRVGVPLGGVGLGQCLKSDHASAPDGNRPVSSPAGGPRILQLSGDGSVAASN